MFGLKQENLSMGKTKMRYFEQEDILYLAISDDDWSSPVSVESLGLVYQVCS